MSSSGEKWPQHPTEPTHLHRVPANSSLKGSGMGPRVQPPRLAGLSSRLGNTNKQTTHIPGNAFLIVLLRDSHTCSLK